MTSVLTNEGHPWISSSKDTQYQGLSNPCNGQHHDEKKKLAKQQLIAKNLTDI
tara:strand:- start:182 stop:340 length:159 start_codon:yes stop_codon:yes gene_type:complete